MPVRLVLLISAVTCSTEPQTTSAPNPAPTTQRPATRPTPAKQATARPRPDAGYSYEAEGVRFVVRTRLTKLQGGWGVDVEVEADATDNRTHLLHGLANGLGLSGIRFEKSGGGLPLGEMGEPRRFGRVTKGRRLTLKRSFPGRPEPGTAWVPLGPSTSLVLGVRTWHSIEGAGAPRLIEIAGITVVTDERGAPTVDIARPSR